ncbi:MAG: hypothetical protein WA855_02640 [Candidatus Acidiferrales bacterium]
MKKNKKKSSLKKAVDELTAIAEKHLASLPEEERDARVEAFSHAKFTRARDSHAKSSWTARTRGSRAIGRGRG